MATCPCDTSPSPVASAVASDVHKPSAAEPLSESAASEEVLELGPRAEHANLAIEGLLLEEATLENSSVLPYVLMIASVIEGRTIRGEELIAALQRSMRQRSIGRSPRREYVLRYLNQYPP